MLRWYVTLEPGDRHDQAGSGQTRWPMYGGTGTGEIGKMIGRACPRQESEPDFPSQPRR